MQRYNECESLRICVEQGTTYVTYLESAFPSDFFIVVSSREDMMEMLSNNACNVVSDLKSFSAILDRNATILDKNTSDNNHVWGDKLATKEPGAAVTRKDDPEFSRVINWVVNSLFYGEEQGLTKDPSRCMNDTDLTGRVEDLDFLKAVYCVGNYGEIYYGDPNDRGINRINNGTGMIYGTPFGHLNNGNDDVAEGSLANIRERGSLVCGVVVPENVDGEVTESNNVVGMGVDFCLTLAAALFHGDSEDVIFVTFHETDNSSFTALDNHTVDVLVGARVQKKYAFDFSTPYAIFSAMLI